FRYSLLATRYSSMRFPPRLAPATGRRRRPAGHDHPLLSIEQHPFLALNVQIAEERRVPAGKREPRHRRGHTDVDADHAGIETMLDVAGRAAGLRKDHRSIAKFAALAKSQGFVERMDARHRQNRAEDFVPR